jgi:hypothetical protein
MAAKSIIEARCMAMLTGMIAVDLCDVLGEP